MPRRSWYQLIKPVAVVPSDGEPAQGLAAGGGLQQRLDEHDEDAGEGEDVFGEESDDVGGEGH